MATTNNQDSEDFSSPPRSNDPFSAQESPASSFGGSPGIPMPDSPSPKSYKQRRYTQPPTTLEEDVFEETYEETLQQESVEGPALIKVDDDVIYNEMTLKYMRIISKYQELLCTEIALPRLVIAGAQSSGKSSLLENLTGLPVPITPGIGTRFPVEIVLIEDPVYSVKATIIQDVQARRGRATELKKIQDFIRKYDKELTVTEFEELLRETSKTLGLPDPIFAKAQTSESPRSKGAAPSISRHLLRIEMRGPNFKNLSLVDTPGLYKSGNNEQDIGSALEIDKLVQSLISEERTIIIAVMDGRELTAQQSIFGYAEKVDKAGERTVGVLTKCDNLPLDQRHDVQKTLNRAGNKELHLSHGWYVIKNRSSTEAESGMSISSARIKEEELFSTAPWAPKNSGLQKSRMGIDALRTGLSNLFCSHIRLEFPKFNAQTRVLLKQKRAELAALGPSRGNESEQRSYLMGIAERYQSPKHQCLHDNHRLAEPNDPTLIARKLAVLKKVELRDALQSKGSAWQFQSPSRDVDPVSDAAANGLQEDDDGNTNIYTWINTRYQSSKACEVPGLVPYPLVERLFEEQTESWVSITKVFTEKLAGVLKDAVRHCLNVACTNTRVQKALWELIEVQLDEEIAYFLDECLGLIEQHRDGMRIVASETDFVYQLNVARTLRFISAIARLKYDSEVPNQNQPGDITSFKTLNDFMKSNAELMMGVLTNERQIVYQIHDILKTYYNFTIGHYTESVCKNILHDSRIKNVMDAFSQDWVKSLSDKEVEAIAGESMAEREYRASLLEAVNKYKMAISQAEEIMNEVV